MTLLELKMEQAQQPYQQPGTAVLYNAAGQVVAITLPPQSTTYQSYKTGQSMFSGVVLIITGVLSIIFNGIGISLHEDFSYASHGIWCGIMVSKLCCAYYFTCMCNADSDESLKTIHLSSVYIDQIV